MTAKAQTLHQLERGVEEALRDFGGSANGADLPEITAAERIETIGNTTALSIIDASELTAKDIEAAAQAAVEVAADIVREAQQIASDVRENGEKISVHLQEFAALARKVSTAMRDTRADALNPRETPLNN